MEIEIFALCDFAQDVLGKLTIVGTFDTVNTVQTPTQLTSCYIAARIRFDVGQKNKIPLTLTISNAKGENIIQPLEGEINVPVAQGSEPVAQNICVGLNGLQINDFGKYIISLSLNGKEAKALPLYIIKTKVN